MSSITHFLKSFLLLEMLAGMGVTLKNLFARKITVQYPEAHVQASKLLFSTCSSSIIKRRK